MWRKNESEIGIHRKQCEHIMVFLGEAVYAGTILRDILGAIGVALRFSFSSTSLGTLELTLIRRDAMDILAVESTELVETRLGVAPTPGLVVVDFPSIDGAREVDAARDVRVGVGATSDGRAFVLGAGGPIFPMTLARTLLLRALILARGAVEGVSDSLPSLETSDMEEGGREVLEGVPTIDSRLVALAVPGVLDVVAAVTEFFIAIFLLICSGTI